MLTKAHKNIQIRMKNKLNMLFIRGYLQFKNALNMFNNFFTQQF